MVYLKLALKLLWKIFPPSGLGLFYDISYFLYSYKFDNIWGEKSEKTICLFLVDWRSKSLRCSCCSVSQCSSRKLFFFFTTRKFRQPSHQCFISQMSFFLCAFVYLSFTKIACLFRLSEMCGGVLGFEIRCSLRWSCPLVVRKRFNMRWFHPKLGI